jgi:hypothetical protein
MHRSLALRAAAIAVALLVANGCRQNRTEDAISGPSSPGQWSGFSSTPGPILVGHPVKFSDMTESEKKFGIAPRRGPGVEYQDDIILMEHGDQAIHSFASNGLSWTFDANAPQVNQFQVGKIVFATGRAVGRVVALERHGDEVSAILGPVQLTDLVKRGKFSYHQPLDLSQAIAYAAPDYPGAVNSTLLQAAASTAKSAASGAQSSLRRGSGTWHVAHYYVVSDTGKWTPLKTMSGSSTPHFVKTRLLRSHFDPTQGGDIPAVRHNGDTDEIGALTPAQFNLPSLPSPYVPYPGRLGQFAPSPIPFPFPNLPMLDFNHVQATPCMDCGGLGIRMYQEDRGVKVNIEVVFHLDHPYVSFDAEILNGSIAATLQLKGGAGVTVKFDAGSTSEFQGNINEIGMVPVDITVPIGMVLPLSINLGQSIDLESAFSAKISTLHGEGGIALDGAITADYQKGWHIYKPQASVKQDLASLVNGVSVGINSLVFAVNQRLLIGVGTLGFTTGPYVSLISSMTSLKGSSIGTGMLLSGTPICTQGTFDMSLGAGIGYSMPKVVAAVINTILGWFGAKPIQSSGSIIALPQREVLVKRRDQLPRGCAQ